MLPPRHRLRDSADFRSAGRGGRAAGRLVVVHLTRTDADVPVRVGFVVSKAVGNAVVRNRTKRRLRALLAQRLDTLPAGASVVVRARPAAAQATFDDLRAETTSLVERALAAPGRRREARP